MSTPRPHQRLDARVHALEALEDERPAHEVLDMAAVAAVLDHDLVRRARLGLDLGALEELHRMLRRDVVADGLQQLAVDGQRRLGGDEQVVELEALHLGLLHRRAPARLRQVLDRRRDLPGPGPVVSHDRRVALAARQALLHVLVEIRVRGLVRRRLVELHDLAELGVPPVLLLVRGQRREARVPGRLPITAH
jgi:hypothetical protein